MGQPQISPTLFQYQAQALVPVPEAVEDQILLGVRHRIPGLASIVEMSDGLAEGYLKAEFHLSRVAAEEAFTSAESFWAALAEQIPDQISDDLWPVALHGANFCGLAEKTPNKIDMRGQVVDRALTWKAEYMHLRYGDTCYQAPYGSVRVRFHRGSSVAVMGTKDGGADIVWKFGISNHVDDPSACILYTNVEVGAGKEGWTMI